MDINSFIQDRVTDKGVGNTVDMITFNLVHAMDKEHIHIPDWYKNLRINVLMDYFINEGLIEKRQVKYTFNWHKEPVSVFDEMEEDDVDYPNRHNGNLVLTRFGIVELSLETLMILSNILPTPDILEHIKLETTNPYTSPKNPQLQNYNLFGNL